MRRAELDPIGWRLGGAHDIGAPEADYIVQAANAYPGQAEEVARLRERVALLDSLLGECLTELAGRSAQSRDKHHGPARPITQGQCSTVPFLILLIS